MRAKRSVIAPIICFLACTGGAQYGTVELGDLTTEGEVDRDYLYLQLQQLDPTFEACYVRALRRDRTTEGVVRLRMRGAGGKLEPEITANETASADLADCVATAISNLTIVERDSTDSWDFVSDWTVSFTIIRQD
ncbi:MAG: hypothetical protein JSW71_15090 [Gemmatimonadota bacterium]|nr:MAG: hypothetical protein JSW71_15090 [Gemmatimonadota bacterium]